MRGGKTSEFKRSCLAFMLLLVWMLTPRNISGTSLNSTWYVCAINKTKTGVKNDQCLNISLPFSLSHTHNEFALTLITVR